MRKQITERQVRAALGYWSRQALNESENEPEDTQDGYLHLQDRLAAAGLRLSDIVQIYFGDNTYRNDGGEYFDAGTSGFRTALGQLLRDDLEVLEPGDEAGDGSESEGVVLDKERGLMNIPLNCTDNVCYTLYFDSPVGEAESRQIGRAVFELVKDIFDQEDEVEFKDCTYWKTGSEMKNGAKFRIGLRRHNLMMWRGGVATEAPKLADIERHARFRSEPIRSVLAGDQEMVSVAGIRIIPPKKTDPGIETPFAAMAVQDAFFKEGMFDRGDMCELDYDFDVWFEITDVGTFREWIEEAA